MSEVYITHMERQNMKLVKAFDANNKVEAMQIGELRDKLHKEGKSTAIVFIERDQNNRRIHALFIEGELGD